MFQRTLIVLLVACCCMGAGVMPFEPPSDKHIDLVFASGFESPEDTVLTSEIPFSGSLPNPEANHDLVGFTAGDFSVDQTGQANYAIAFFVGTGTVGVTPQVGLRYSSAGGNGQVGVGWSISGTTMIAHCRETAESKDSSAAINPAPISYDDKDKFCLNGERLFVANGGAYGADGTEYRTEKEQFAKITSIGGSGNNPDHFTIQRKDGSTSFYGTTTDAKIIVTHANPAINGKTYSWAINRYQDSTGNYIDYRYQQPAAGELLLTDIDYTGNQAQGLVPYNNLHFTYEARTDRFSSYLGGVAFETTSRLAGVQSSIDNTVVREYTLLYDYSDTNGRSILTAIQECRNNRCLAASTFDWSQPDPKFRTSATGSAQPFPTNMKSSKLGDINGDGRADLVFVDSDNHFNIGAGSGSTGFGTVVNTTISAPSDSEIDNKWHLLDYNADGRMDLMKQSGSNWVVHLATTGSVGFSTTATATGLTAQANSDFQIIDINGDGLPDLLYPQGQLAVRYLERDGSSYRFSNSTIVINLPNQPSQIPGITPPTEPINFLVYRFYKDEDPNIQARDINGDGVADLLLRTDVYYIEDPIDPLATEQPYRFLSAGEQLDAPGEPTEVLDSSHWVAFIGKGLAANGKLDYSSEHYYISPTSSLSDDADQDIRFADLNSDGLTDLIAKSSTNNWHYRLSNGQGFDASSNIPAIKNEKYLQLMDYNLDGYIDLIYPSQTVTTEYYALTWQGNGFSATATATGAKAQSPSQQTNLFMDLNGDGAANHIRIDSSGNQHIYPRQQLYQPVDKITTFTNGMGAKQQILYRPLTFSTVYQQGDHQTTALNYGQGSPVLDVMAAIYVVRQVKTDSPIEGDPDFQNTTRYRYQDAKVQTGGRGFLGFKKVIASTPVQSAQDSQAKTLERTTTYHQDFPYNGIPETIEIRQLAENFYAPDNTPPICGPDDGCFPDPCLPGEICTQLPKSTDFTLSYTTNSVAKIDSTAKTTFPYVSTSSTRTYSPETQALLKTETQSSTHDSFGNPLTHTLRVYDGSGTLLHTTTTTNSYSNLTSSGKWLLGLLETSTTTKTRAGSPSISSLTEFDYDPNSGLLLEERQDPNAGIELFLRKRYQYDPFGNTIKVIECSGTTLSSAQCQNNPPTAATDANPYHIHRYRRTTFDAKGRYLKATYNTAEHKLTEVLSRDIYGNPTSSINLLGQTTTNSYDGFGNLYATRNSLGKWSQTSRQWCQDTFCPPDTKSKIRVRKMDAGGNTSYIYMDLLGREIATLSRSFNDHDDPNTSGDDRYVLNQIFHDSLGRKTKSIGDHFLGATVNIPTTQTEYDRYNRATKIILPDNSSETISYSSLSTHYRNHQGQTRQETKNALNQLTQVEDFDDASGTYKNRLNYRYDSQGSLLSISRTIDQNGSLTEQLLANSYDRRGRKIATDDVDSGFSQISYNALNEIVQTTDALNNHIKTYYDHLGQAYRTESWHNTTLLTRNTNSYHASNGLLLQQSKQTFADASFYTQTHSYDPWHRPQSTQVTFSDLDNRCPETHCSYQAALYYDQYSRLKYQQDASGKAIQNHYNAQGYLAYVTAANQPTKEYYRINQTDKWGNVSRETKGGNSNLISTYTAHPTRGWLNSINSANQNLYYEYDSLGNLIKRTDLLNNQSECLHYDRLNRLTDSYRYTNYSQNCAVTNGHAEHQITAYDNRGNITQKDGQNYSYQTALPNAIGASPHQAQSKGSQTFSYDQRGNLTTSTNFRNGQGQLLNRNLSYTAFNKIKTIYTGSNPANPVSQSTYRYDNAEQRYSRTDTNHDGETTVTHFIGNVQIEYSPSGQIAYKRHLGNYAIITETNGSSQIGYLFHDHLGSIDIITDPNGKPLQSMSFDAWGKRRLPANWQQMPLPNIRDYLSHYTTNGFTGHEMLDAFGIINMGGRIYDAELGRMLQADPIVQDPNTSQSHNRYSYVHNNPLSFTDPTGYFSLRRLVAVVVGVVLSIFLPGLGFSLFWTAFTAAFASNYIITGNLKSSLRAGLIAGAVACIGGYLSQNIDHGTTVGGQGDTVSNTALTESTPEVTASAGSTVAVQNSISPIDLVSQITSSINPEAGAILNFLNGGNLDLTSLAAAGRTFNNLLSHYGKFKATEELQRFARKNGLSLGELQMIMFTMSFVGNKLVGTRFNPQEKINEEPQQMMHGMFDRQYGGLIDPRKRKILSKIMGSPFDVIDVILGYTGMLTASDYHFIYEGNPNQRLLSHSLGTLGASNLVSRGYLDASFAELYSLPFGNVAPSGVKLFIGTIDGVNGFFFGKLFNPTATMVGGCLHPFDCYLRKTQRSTNNGE